MDYEAVISHRLTKEEVLIVRDELISEKESFSDFFQLIFQKPVKTAWQVAWICEKVSEADVTMFTDEDYHQLMDFTLTNNEDGLQRLCLSIILNLPLRKPVSVEFINLCFDQMISPRKPVGVQVLSMKILRKICIAVPDLGDELLVILENTDDLTYSPGFISARKHVIKSLKTNIKGGFGVNGRLKDYAEW